MTPRWPDVALAALLGAACSDVGQAQISSADPETPRRIAIAQSMAPPCLSIAVEQATISLPGNELMRAVQGRRASATAPEDETQRQAWIAGGRAQTLLAIASDQRDRFGCTLVDRRQVPADGMYLVGRLLESGRAAVWTTAPPGLAAAIEVRRSNPQCRHGPMGHAAYRVAAGGPPLLMLIECVT
ncbi:hypothetical protein QSH18_07665 [Xanthomonas sp. NCPPB 2654]|uniref:hypothetical protein n=1 Tax=unclassified Xanthomonas TaxID=2643310 RepID=UPI0021E002DE|nr:MULTISPECIES: hypothetical protein [unclassified Xanthomonas]MDL5365480.1 hypothetical protein [Xanthomonas sp. NCPPB 2654]UYC19177.1 hypothetical protein NUG20_13385 [Xanthomonas sp. CFBP 8443]